MTEDEAKTQPCIGPEGCGQYVHGERLCAGSRCGMAWRWIDAGTEWSGRYTSQDAPPGEGWEVDIQPGDRSGRWVRPKPPTEGYCGLAGKP